MAENCCTVLLINSSTADRAFLRHCLEQDELYSYEILEAATGIAGLHLGQCSQPDIILLDSDLPDCNASDLINQFQQYASIPILLLIAQNDRYLLAQALQWGAADYLAKPDLSAELLRRTVRSTIKQHRLQQQVTQYQATIATLAIQSVKNYQQQQLNQVIQQESEAKFRQLAEHIRDAFFICTPNLDHYFYISPATERIWGIAISELYQNPRRWMELVHPEDWDYFLTHTPIGNLASEYDLEYRILRPDGEIRWVHVRAYPVRNAQNQVDRMVGVCEDITDRKQVELALRQSEERWQLAIEGSNDGIWDQNLLTNEHFLSPRCLEMLGYNYTEINSFEKWYEQVHPDDRLALKTTFQAYLDRQTPIYAAEYRMRCQDGSYKWLLARGKAFWDEAGTPIRAIGSITDITLRRQTELELQQLNADLEQRVQQRTQELIQSTQDLRTIFNNVYDALLIHDLDGTILDTNDRSLELRGATREQLMGATIMDLSAPDAPLERLPEILQRVRAGETIRFEWKERRFDDHSTFDVEVSLRPVTLNNRLVFIAGVRDISDRKRAELALRESQLFLQTVIDTFPLAVFWKDRHSVYLGCNQKSAEAAGVASPTEIVGKTDYELAWGQTNGDDYRADDHEVMTSGQAKLGIIETQVRADSSTIWIETNKLPLYNLDGEMIGVLGTYQDITKHKQTETSLQAERLRLQLALDAANMGTWSCTLQTGTLIWSDRAQEIFGFIPGTFPGDRDTFLALVHPEDRERVMQAIAHTFATGTPYNIEYRIRCLDGTTRWIAVWGIIPAELSGTEQQLIGVVCDITDRKQIEQELQESRNMLKLVLDAIPQRVFWKDRQSRFLGCNSAFADDYHLTLTEIVGKTDHELPWAAWADLYQADDTQVINTRTPKLNYEEPTTDLNGRQIWIRSSKVPLTDSQGNVIGILGCYDDITDLKWAEAELREVVVTNQALLNAIPDLIMRISRDGYYRDNVPSHNVLLLLPRNELVGKSVWEVLPEELAQQRLATIEQAFQTGLPQVHEYQIYINGEWRYEEARCVICRDDEAMVLIRDITDRKQAEIALQQLNLELEQRVSDRTFELQKAMEAAEAANRAKSTFLANMSHELRTPLNAILGFAQLLSRDLTMSSEQRQQLNIINRSGQHLLNLINDILEMSKIEAGRLHFVPQSFDLSAMLNTLEDMLQMRAVEKGLPLLVDRDPALPRYIETDENKLRQILINLVGNAIKFTTSGQVVLRISVRDHTNTDRQGCELPTLVALEFAVEDTGIGIDPDELDHLFEPFIQSRDRHVSQEGTGLGLPISRQFVQLLGGDLTVHSIPGVGSTFTFTIPVRLAEAVDQTNPIFPRRIIGLAPNQPSYRILVVEDNDTNRLLLVQLLQAVGFEVQAASNGQEAIAQWQSWHPHLIWMDIRMPMIDGYEATRQIRGMEAQRQAGGDGGNTRSPTKIIALTASAFEEDRARVLNVGCNDFVRKPFQEAELLEKIAEHLGVQYVDAQSDEGVKRTTIADSFDPIAALQALPTRMLTQLHQATIQLDGQQLARAIEDLTPTYPSLAAFLTEKLENFDFEQILQLLQTIQPLE